MFALFVVMEHMEWRSEKEWMLLDSNDDIVYSVESETSENLD